MNDLDFLSLYEELNSLNEEIPEFTDATFPSSFKKQTVYTLTDNYWLYAHPNKAALIPVAKNYVLDPDNAKLFVDTYTKHTKELKNIEFGNTKNPYIEGDYVLFLPKGTQLIFIKDIIISHMIYQMFSTGKLVLKLEENAIKKFLK